MPSEGGGFICISEIASTAINDGGKRHTEPMKAVQAK